MNSNKRAFSFVEIIITLSIVVLLAVIGLNANNSYQDRTTNAKIVSDIDTINNALTQYANENASLPMPGGNNNFFKTDASYAHSYDENETFGVHGFITEDTIPKKYLQVTPLDPSTNQYYAYGKTKEQNPTITNYSKVANQFEIAGVFKEGNTSSAFVRGNYTSQIGPFNLIREYNGPNFVFDKGIYLPYNGDERLLTAKISDYSGDVTINGNTENITSKELVAGDEIVVPAGETADIYFSDGSKSILGDASEESRLVLSQLDFVKETNLATKVKLVLGGGTLWNKATNLDQDSGFEIYTTDSTAAVRGTIFGVNKTTNNTNVTVQKGRVEIAKVTSATDNDELKNQVKEDSVEKTLIPNTDGTDDESVIESDGASKGITIDGATGNSSSDTDAANTIIERVEDEVINEIGDISNTIIPVIDSFTRDGDNFSVSLPLNEIYQNAEFLKIEYDEDNVTASLFNIIPKANAGETVVAFLENNWKESGTLTLTQNTEFTKLDNSKIRLGQLSQVTLFFGNRLGDGTLIETRGQALNLDGTVSYERGADGEIAGIIDSSVGGDTPPANETPTLPPETPLNCDYGVSHGDRKTFFKAATVEHGNTCEQVLRECSNGQFLGDTSFTYVACSVGPAESCTVAYSGYTPSGISINHGETTAVAKSRDIDGGIETTTKTVTCDDGELLDVEEVNIECSDPSYEKDGESCRLKAETTDTLGEPGYGVYAYAEYNTSGDIKLKKVGHSTYTQEQVSILGNNGIPYYCGAGSVQNNSFCATGGAYGIYIDSDGNGQNGYNDYLKYSGLGLSGNFAVEVNVNTDALKQTGSRYIFDTEVKGTGILISKDGGGNHTVRLKGETICNDASGSRCNLSFGNGFTKIIFVNGQYIKIGNTKISTGHSISISDFYLGSRRFGGFQIHGIVDYLKIYKK